MSSLLQLRLQKLWFSASHPRCWRALRRGVAPALEHRQVLQAIECDRLLDVGANRGQFSLMLRLLQPHVPIHAYEPQPGEAAVYRSVFHGAADVQLHETALGDQPGTAELHLSGRRDSSSLLPIGELQATLFAGTAEVGTLGVPVATLDSLESHWRESSRAMLKLDVQGFELSVLRGARAALKRCAYVYAECSDVPLYTGQALYPEVADFLASAGFKPVRRHNEQWAEGRLVQADYLFGRP